MLKNKCVLESNFWNTICVLESIFQNVKKVLGKNSSRTLKSLKIL